MSHERQCHHCHKVLSTKYYRIRHEQKCGNRIIDREEKIFKCDHCYKTFTCKRNLEQHAYACTCKATSLTCSVCNRVFHNSGNLSRHKKICSEKSLTLLENGVEHVLKTLNMNMNMNIDEKDSVTNRPIIIMNYNVHHNHSTNTTNTMNTMNTLNNNIQINNFGEEKKEAVREALAPATARW